MLSITLACAEPGIPIGKVGGGTTRGAETWDFASSHLSMDGWRKEGEAKSYKLYLQQT
jgi:hypothetical protein